MTVDRQPTSDAISIVPPPTLTPHPAWLSTPHQQTLKRSIATSYCSLDTSTFYPQSSTVRKRAECALFLRKKLYCRAHIGFPAFETRGGALCPLKPHDPASLSNSDFRHSILSSEHFGYCSATFIEPLEFECLHSCSYISRNRWESWDCEVVPASHASETRLDPLFYNTSVRRTAAGAVKHDASRKSSSRGDTAHS